AGEADDADEAAKSAAAEAAEALEPLAADREAAEAADKDAKARVKAAKAAVEEAAEAEEAAITAAEEAAAPPEGPVFPPILDPITEKPYAPPAVDAYSLRLVTARRLYDHGTLIAAAPSLAKLGEPGQARINRADLKRFAVDEGDTVTLTSPSGSLDVELHGDDRVPAGSIVLPWNRGGPDPTAVIDSSAGVTEVR